MKSVLNLLIFYKILRNVKKKIKINGKSRYFKQTKITQKTIIPFATIKQIQIILEHDTYTNAYTDCHHNTRKGLFR